MQNEFDPLDPILANAHSLIEEGHRDLEAGRVPDVDEVFDTLFAELDEKIKSTKRSTATEDPASFTRRKR